MSQSADLRAGIDLAVDVQSFFAELLAEAQRGHRVRTTKAAETYVVALLAEFAHPQPRLEEDGRPFTFLLEEALRSRPLDRFARLKDLGDRVLYTAGFFRAHLEQRGVELDYVEALGARAYDAASAMLRGRSGGVDRALSDDVLGELASRFNELAGLLAEVNELLLARSAHSPVALLRVYERWLRTGSAALASALSERGLAPQRNGGGVH